MKLPSRDFIFYETIWPYQQIQLLNFFVAGTRQMINLDNQNEHHARKHNAVLQVMATWRSYIFATYPNVAQHHINLFGYINTYTFNKCTRE